MEFTIERGKLYMLQTRSAKRTAAAAVKIAVDMVNEGLITKDEAVAARRAGAGGSSCCCRASTRRRQRQRARAAPAGQGPERLAGRRRRQGGLRRRPRRGARGKAGERVILVRDETNPDDVHGMIAAQGHPDRARRAHVSHAAVVARGMGKPCVVGARRIRVDLEKRQFTARRRGDPRGRRRSRSTARPATVFAGAIKTVDADYDEEADLADAARLGRRGAQAGRLGQRRLPARRAARRDLRRARASASAAPSTCSCEQERLPDRAEDDPRADEGGASGGARHACCPSSARTSRASSARCAIPDRRGLPVIIRLIDPPLHEFLPCYEELLARGHAAGDHRGDQGESAA